MTAVDAAPLTDAVVAARLTGDRCVILLDVDGTLAPIAPRPEDAVVPAATRAAVARLTQCRGTIVGLVSGRAAADARRMVDVPELWTIGNHGAETIAPDGTAFVHPDVAAAAPAVATARADLEAEIAGVPGAHVENKRWSLSVHVRLTPPELAPGVVAIAERVARHRGLRAVLGKAVVELRAPARVDKGTATVALVERLLEDAREPSIFFVGDDVTDEDGFRALRDRFPHAVTVRVLESGVAPAATHAEFTVDSTESVRRLLEQIAEFRVGRLPAP